MYIVHMYIVHTRLLVPTVHMYIVLCTMYCVPRTSYMCTMYCVLCTRYIVHSTCVHASSTSQPVPRTLEVCVRAHFRMRTALPVYVRCLRMCVCVCTYTSTIQYICAYPCALRILCGTKARVGCDQSLSVAYSMEYYYPE